MASKVAEAALINKTKKVRLYCELHVDRRKILQRELDELYKELGKTVYEESEPDSDSWKILRENVEEKKLELEAVKSSPNDATDITELTTKLSEYVIDHFTGDIDGSISKQVMPLMANVMADALAKYIGEFRALVLLSTSAAKDIILYCMVVGFMFYNLLKTHGIKIVSTEEPVTDAQIMELEQLARENADTVAKLLLGPDAPLQVNTDTIRGLDDEESSEEEP